MIIKLKTFENLEKYSEWIIKVLDMLFIQFRINSGIKGVQKLPEPEINESNQFQMLHLFALFDLNEKKQKLTEFIQTNINSKNVFNYLLWIAEYIRAGLQEAYVEEIKYWYWLIVYILLRKHTNGKDLISVQINSFLESPIYQKKFTDLDTDDYVFDNYELYYTKSKESVNLNLFIYGAWLVNDEKDAYFKTSMSFYPWKVIRTKSEEGMISDYPHYYKIVSEDKSHPVIFATRNSINGRFRISKLEGDYTLYGPNYLGMLKANFWGTGFDLIDYGIEFEFEEGIIPEGFLTKPKPYGKIQYETNILAEVPRAFKFTFENPERDYESTTLQNVKPVFNAERGCYCLNFYGRALTASAKNFQLVETDDTDEDIVLMHGKEKRNEYNVDYRSPLNPVQSFCISLAAIGNKRAVG